MLTPAIPFAKYLVWQCLHCGYWQGKQNIKYTTGMSETGKSEAIAKLNLKCMRCRKTIKFKDNEQGGVRVKHHWTNNPYEATKLIKALKQLQSNPGRRAV